MAPPTDLKNCALPVWCGHQTDFQPATATSPPRMLIRVKNVYAFIERGTLLFGVEEYLNGQPISARWMTETAYMRDHLTLWRAYDMEPNREFNVGEGLRSEGGEHLSGSNRLVERDGTPKMDNIRTACPASDPNKCGGCDAATKPDGGELMRCARCKQTKYCSKECQTGDWGAHKAACKEAAP